MAGEAGAGQERRRPRSWRSRESRRRYRRRRRSARDLEGESDAKAREVRSRPDKRHKQYGLTDYTLYGSYQTMDDFQGEDLLLSDV